jgi:hypothetical protein
VPADLPIAADRAVIDRIVDGVAAVLLVGPAEAEVHLPADQLPDEAMEGDWVIVDHDTDPPSVTGVDFELTAARRDDLEQRMDRIRRERSGGRFGKR